MQDVRLSIRADAQIQQQLRSLRVGWRDYCWTQFLASGRHEAEDVGTVDIRAMQRCDFKHLGSLMVDHGCRSVALGATVSPAWFRERTEVASDRCPWCPALGTWDHLCWLCPESPLQGVRPAIPRCPILCRWGWGTEAQANRIDPSLLVPGSEKYLGKRMGSLAWSGLLYSVLCSCM